MKIESGSIISLWEPKGLKFNKSGELMTSEYVSGSGVMGIITPNEKLHVIKKDTGGKWICSWRRMRVLVHKNHIDPNTQYSKEKAARRNVMPAFDLASMLHRIPLPKDLYWKH